MADDAQRDISRNAKPTPRRALRSSHDAVALDALGVRSPKKDQQLTRLAGKWFEALGLGAVLMGCTANLGDIPGGSAGSSAGGVASTAGADSNATAGFSAQAGGSAAGGGAAVSGGAGAVTAGGAPVTSSGGEANATACTTIAPGRAPLRRLTTNEFNNTIKDLLGDASNPGNEFPSEILGKGFGNDADLQSVSDLLAEKYYSVAEGIAARATASPAALAKLHSCASDVTSATEETCVRSILNSLLPRAYRRTVTTSEIDELVELYRATRALSSSETFASGVAAVLTAILQAPDFLYRPEFGRDGGSGAARRLSGRELATRLSYLFWQTMPDADLFQAADSGALDTNEGVVAQARRLLADPRSHAMVSFFFNNLLPISDLSNLTRDPKLFPNFSASVGAALRQEVQRLLEYEIFENTKAAPGSPYAPGSWPAALTAPYTFVNEALFKFYGPSTFAAGTTVTGSALQKVELNTSQRLGLLTLGGVMAGTATTNLTNPVLRGAYVVKHLMCREIPLPNFAVTPPEPYSGKTARERFSKHSMNPGCAGCHQYMDPVGLALENYDAIGLYRTTERTTIDGITYDTPIDATGSVPGVEGTATNPVELVQLLASSEEMETCFATNWMQFAYGRVLDSADECNRRSVQAAFKTAGYNVKELLLALTQADAFSYLPNP